MNRFRRIWTGASLAVIAAMVVLSVVSAFLGVERTAEGVQSNLAVGFWILLAVLLAGSLLSFRKTLRRPGVAAMHVGALLILAGGIWGSQWRWDRLDDGTLFKAVIALGPGQSCPDIPASGDNFDLTLLHRWREFYPAEENRWNFYFQTSPREAFPIHWRLGEAKILGDSGLRLRVLEYRTDEDFPQAGLLVCKPQQTLVFPFDPQDPKPMEAGGVTIRVLRTYRNFKMSQDLQGKTVVQDVPGEGTNPVAEIEINGKNKLVFAPAAALIMERLGMRTSSDDDPLLMYFPPSPRRFGRLASPAVRLEISDGLRTETLWTAVDEFKDKIRLPLGGDPNHVIWIVREQPVKDYKAELFASDGQTRARKIIEFNEPMHFGGYHIYLQKFGENGKSVELLFVSDSGWMLVWIGFVMLGAGVLWEFWGRAILRASRPRARGEGDS